jgi:hypothetical protein
LPYLKQVRPGSTEVSITYAHGVRKAGRAGTRHRPAPPPRGRTSSARDHQCHDGLSRASIARAIRPGSRRIRSQREALRRGLACPDLAHARRDFRGNLTAFWRIHVHHASWGGPGRPPHGTTEPTRARVCELAGISVSTYKACRRWWEARGYLAVVRPGWTPDLGPGVLRTGDDHNIRQAYVLCVPRKTDKTGPTPGRSPVRTLTRPLSWSRRDLDRLPAREKHDRKPGQTWKTGAPRPAVLSRGLFAAITDGWWAHITAPFAAWPAADLVHAVDHLPGGRQHRTRLDSVRHPAAWLRWRLSHWLNPDGTPLPSPSQARADAAARHRAGQAAQRAEAARTAAARSVDPGGNAARARAMLSAALGRPLPRDTARYDLRPQNRPRTAPTAPHRPAPAPSDTGTAPGTVPRREPGPSAWRAQEAAGCAAGGTP